MTEPVDADALARQWAELAGTGAEAREQGAALIAAYAQPHRRYHTLRHLAHVLEVARQLAQEAADVRAVLFAAWFHDAVYEVAGEDAQPADEDGGALASGRAVSNEERSARLAEAWLARLGEPPQRVAQVGRLVRLTAGHAVAPGDRDGAVLCDADLAVLAGDPEQYRAYAAAVREEYARVPDALFRQGRAAVLRDLLALPVLFHTRAGRERFEAAARANLAAEIALLTRGD